MTYKPVICAINITIFAAISARLARLANLIVKNCNNSSYSVMGSV